MQQENAKKADDIVFGIRAVIEAIKSGKDVDKVLIKRALKGELIQELMDVLREYDISFAYVPIEKLNRVTRKNHQGVIAMISPITFSDVDEVVAQTFENGKIPFFIALDGVTDVRNFGAIVRSAECAGVDGIIIPEKGGVRIGPDAVKTSVGAIFNIPICRVPNMKKALINLQQSGMILFGASEKASQNYYSFDLTVPVCMVMGAEDTGISNDVIRIIDNLVSIPLYGKIGSLNVSVATSILMYEVVRQRLNG
jgi:23S rRNA (guanosine2251-2'-O)-methyltransferase